jgi:hypothetical protein
LLGGEQCFQFLAQFVQLHTDITVGGGV